MAKQCWRCGHVAAADGHTTYGETRDCEQAFAFAQRLARWTGQWLDDPIVMAVEDGEPRPEGQNATCLLTWGYQDVINCNHSVDDHSQQSDNL